METLKKKILSSSGSSDGESGNESPSDELEMSDIESIYNGIDSDFEEDSELNNSRRELQGSLRQALKTSLNESQALVPSPKNVNLSSPLGVTSTSLEASTSTAIVGHIPRTTVVVEASFKKVKVIGIKHFFNSKAYYKTTFFIIDSTGAVAGSFGAILLLVYGKYMQATRKSIIEPHSDWESFITKIRGKCPRIYLRRDTYNITKMSTKLMGKIQIGSNTIKRGVLFAKKILHFDNGQVKCHPTFLKKLFSKGSDIKTIIEIEKADIRVCIDNMRQTRPDLSIYRRMRQINNPQPQSDDNPAPKKKPRLTRKLLPKKKRGRVSTLQRGNETLITLTDGPEVEPEVEPEVVVEPEVEPETFSNVNRYNSMVRAIELLNIKIDQEFIDGIKPLICKSAKIDPAQMVTLFAGMLHWRTKNTEDHPTIIISDEEKSLIVNIMNLN